MIVKIEENHKIKLEEYRIDEVYFYLLVLFEEYKFSKIPSNLWCDLKGHISLLKGNIRIKVADFLNKRQIEALNQRIKGE